MNNITPDPVYNSSNQQGNLEKVLAEAVLSVGGIALIIIGTLAVGQVFPIMSASTSELMIGLGLGLATTAIASILYQIHKQDKKIQEEFEKKFAFDPEDGLNIRASEVYDRGTWGLDLKPGEDRVQYDDSRASLESRYSIGLDLEPGEDEVWADDLSASND